MLMLLMSELRPIATSAVMSTYRFLLRFCGLAYAQRMGPLAFACRRVRQRSAPFCGGPAQCGSGCSSRLSGGGAFGTDTGCRCVFLGLSGLLLALMSAPPVLMSCF